MSYCSVPWSSIIKPHGMTCLLIIPDTQTVIYFSLLHQSCILIWTENYSTANFACEEYQTRDKCAQLVNWGGKTDADFIMQTFGTDQQPICYTYRCILTNIAIINPSIFCPFFRSQGEQTGLRLPRQQPPAPAHLGGQWGVPKPTKRWMPWP